MSIREKLEKLLSDRKLFKLESDWGEETPRTMYVSANVHAAVMGPFPETQEGQLRAELAAWMLAFMENNEISVSEKPFDKPPDTMLARVHPPEKEFWSIRAFEDLDENGHRKSPGVRALGAFVAKDEFVALVWDTRQSIDTGFDDIVCDVIEVWRDHFGNEKPHSGENLNAYLSNWIDAT